MHVEHVFKTDLPHSNYRVAIYNSIIIYIYKNINF